MKKVSALVTLPLLVARVSRQDQKNEEDYHSDDARMTQMLFDVPLYYCNKEINGTV